MSQEIRSFSLRELQQGARAMQEALKLEKERAAYFQSLYDDIVCSRNHFGDYTEERGKSAAVDSQALYIIDAKAAYDRRIQKKREKYIRWLVFLDMVSRDTADVLKRYLESGEPVKDSLLQRAMREGAKEWEQLENGRGKSLDEEARDYLAYMREQFPELFRTSKKKYKYLIDGEIVSMTVDQHESYSLMKKWDEEKRVMMDIRQHRAN